MILQDFDRYQLVQDLDDGNDDHDEVGDDHVEGSDDLQDPGRVDREGSDGGGYEDNVTSQVANTILIIIFSNSNNLNKFW